jgi:hypothetical protein
MNRENYKINRNQPKRDSTVSKAKIQMLAKPKPAPVNAKLNEHYKASTEWLAKVIPKLKEK